MATSKKIEQALGLITETYKTELTSEMLTTWTMALKDIPDQFIIQGVENLVKTWKWEPFKPKTPGPAELYNICKKLQKGNAITVQIESQQPQLEHKEAKKIYKEINRNILKKRKKGELDAPKTIQKKLIIEEAWCQSGKPKSYSCYDHVDANLFREQCLALYGNIPYTVNHIWMKDVKKHEKDENGHIKRSVNVFIPCSQNDYGSVKMTVGVV
jgi:hypothetical protein